MSSFRDTQNAQVSQKTVEYENSLPSRGYQCNVLMTNCVFGINDSESAQQAK